MAENSHQPTRWREREMKCFKAAGQVQRFLSAHDQINNVFHLRRDHVTASQFEQRGPRPSRPRLRSSAWPLGHRRSWARPHRVPSPLHPLELTVPAKEPSVRHSLHQGKCRNIPLPRRTTSSWSSGLLGSCLQMSLCIWSNFETTTSCFVAQPGFHGSCRCG